MKNDIDDLTVLGEVYKNPITRLARYIKESKMLSVQDYKDGGK